MIEYGGRIPLEPEGASSFFYEAFHPDKEQLRRRDAFFQEIERKLSLQINGMSSIVFEIPDLDVSALLQNDDGHRMSDNQLDIEHGGKIPLKQKETSSFFHEAFHPDKEQLRHRDAFLQEIERELSPQIGEMNISFEIPDLDISPLLQNDGGHNISDNPLDVMYLDSMSLTSLKQMPVSSYFVEETMNIAA